MESKYLANYLGRYVSGGLVSAGAGRVWIKPPAGFGWTPPVKVRAEDGAFVTNFNPDAWKPATEVTYYVATNGNDSNDGLSVSSPKRGIDAALTAANAGGKPATIYISAGIYNRANSFNAVNPTVDLCIIATGGRVRSAIYDALTWGSVGSDTYSSTRSNVAWVLDTTQTNADGDFVLLAQVADLTECQATPGSWAQDGTTLYVHRADGSAPTTTVTGGNTLPIITSTNFDPNTAGRKHYIEGVDFWGGLTAGVCVCRAGDRIVFNDCSFAYGGNPNISGFDITCGLRNNAVPLLIANNCRAHHNAMDGISFNDAGAVGVRGILLDCEAYENGYAGGHSCNGFTAHNGTKMVVVNGDSTRSYGPNVAIIDAGTQAWCLGTHAADSYGDDDSGPEDFWASGSGCEMWLDTCTSNSTDAIVALSDATVYTYDFTGNGTQTGDVQAYDR